MPQNQPITTVIFDLDGVLLSERHYWQAASATVENLLQELGITCLRDMSLPNVGIIPLRLIDENKGRGVNSNWDLTSFVLTGILALAFAKQQPETQSEISVAQPTLLTNAALGWADWAKIWRPVQCSPSELMLLANNFWAHLSKTTTGHAVMEAWYAFLCENVLALTQLWQSSALARFSLSRFQDQKVLHNATNAAVDATRLTWALQHLASGPLTLGIATGRPEREAMQALNELGLLSCFSLKHIATNDQVQTAETVLRQAPLGKPHPYCILQAAYPEHTPSQICDPVFLQQDRPWLVYIGDAGSDVLAARAAGAVAWAVLTGCADPEFIGLRKQQMLDLQATRTFPDVLDALELLRGTTT